MLPELNDDLTKKKIGREPQSLVSSTKERFLFPRDAIFHPFPCRPAHFPSNSPDATAVLIH